MQCGVMKRNELSKSRTGETIMDKTINSINGLAKEWHGTDVKLSILLDASFHLEQPAPACCLGQCCPLGGRGHFSRQRGDSYAAKLTSHSADSLF